jgi:hypothetical protein
VRTDAALESSGSLYTLYRQSFGSRYHAGAGIDLAQIKIVNVRGRKQGTNKSRTEMPQQQEALEQIQNIGNEVQTRSQLGPALEIAQRHELNALESGTVMN